MSDTFEVVINENPFELVFSDNPVEVVIQEDNLEVLVNPLDVVEIVIQNEDVEILTIAEQGPAAIGFPMHVGPTPPSSPAIGDLWLDTN